MFSSIGVAEQRRGEFKSFFGEYEQRINAGMSLDVFVEKAKQRFELNIQAGGELLNEFVSRFEVNPTMQALLSELSGNYRLGLLTNMYPGMFEAIKSRGLLPDINWEVVVDSSLEGIAKPQPEIYLLAQKRIGLKSENIIFVDNSEVNIIAAQKIGWETVLYDPSRLSASNKTVRRALSI
jgi:epoxide hydrolase-like predicted phosphatase